MTSVVTGTKLDWALYYSSLGWYLIPIYEVGPDGVCACGGGCADKGGKHPRISSWNTEASNDPEQIRQWWTQWPSANIAVNCGMSGLVVIDLDLNDDGRHGAASLQEHLFARQIPMPPDPLLARTGGGGNHVFYRMGNHQVGSRNAWLDGVDVKAIGGYVLLAPSNHLANMEYVWNPALNGQGVHIGEITDALAEILPKPGGGNGSKREGPDPALDGPPIIAGERNQELFKIACAARTKGMTRNAILGLLFDVNQHRCQPPIEDTSELELIANSAMRYDPGRDDLPNWPPKDLEAEGGNRYEGEPGRRNLTDVGNGYRLIDKYGDQLRFCPQMKTWFVWDGKRWREDTRNDVKYFASQTALSIYEEGLLAKKDGDDDLGTDLMKWAKQSENDARLKAMVSQAESDRRVVVGADEFDTDPFLFNTPTGTLDLRNYTYKPHDPADLITVMSPTNWTPGATDPVWERALNDALPDPDMRQYVQRFFGTCLTGDTSEKAILVPNGPHDTGKSTITEAILRTLGVVDEGGYASTWEQDVIENSSRANRAEKLHKVRAARLVIAGELHRGSKMADAFVKQISGADTMDARALYKGSFSYRPKFKLVMPTNFVPRSSDPALQSRLKLIPFTHKPPVIDRNIKKHLENEKAAHEAILAWLVEGERQRRAEQSLGPTPWLAEEIANYARESDPILDFTTHVLMPWPVVEESIHVNLAWKLYDAWANTYLSRQARLARRNFEQAMLERGFTKRRIPAKGGPMCWEGLTINHEDLPDVCQELLAMWNMTNGNRFTT